MRREDVMIVRNEIPILEYDARAFGTGSHEKALLLGLDILRNYRQDCRERTGGAEG